MRLLLVTALLLLLYSTSSIRVQGVSARGKLKCGEKIHRNVAIKLYDLDRNPGDDDDLLDEKYTNKDGEFMVTGTTRELTDIEPVLYIYHDCNDDIRPCQKRVTMHIPKQYIHSGVPSIWFDVGELNLEMEFPGQDRSCNH